MEEHLRSHLGQPIVMLFDMTNTSLRHLVRFYISIFYWLIRFFKDYDLAKFIVYITQIYYPGLVRKLFFLIFSIYLSCIRYSSYTCL